MPRFETLKLLQSIQGLWQSWFYVGWTAFSVLDNASNYRAYMQKHVDKTNSYQKDNTMPERLVDVLSGNGTVLPTFPITMEDTDNTLSDVDYQEKALKAAGYVQLVTDADLDSLTTRMHVTRSGQLSPFGADRGLLCETKAGLNQLAREHAYRLWQQEGCPDGRADEFWHRACHQQLRERAYSLWQQETCPDGRADQHWHETHAFEIG